MDLEDQIIIVATASGDLRVKILGDALGVLWGKDTGPQNASGLVAEHRALLERVALRKWAAGMSEDMIVTVTDLDVEDGLDAEAVGAWQGLGQIGDRKDGVAPDR